MRFDRDDLLAHVKGVEREYGATRMAMDRFKQAVQSDLTVGVQGVKVRDVWTASDRLEATYVIRLFAAFEAAVRGFWSETRTTDPPARMRDIIESVGAVRRIPSDWINAAHHFRYYRTSLVHPGQNTVPIVTIATARSSLCRFLICLPVRW